MMECKACINPNCSDREHGGGCDMDRPKTEIEKLMAENASLKAKNVGFQDVIHRAIKQLVDAGIACQPNGEAYLLTAVVTLAVERITSLKSVLDAAREAFREINGLVNSEEMRDTARAWLKSDWLAAQNKGE